MPSTVEGLRELPGVGPYTAAAVASIAFGVVTPVLDGNVERVVCRLLALDTDPRRSAARRELLETAAALLDPERPGDSNQALMELGARLCTPRSPRCWECPLASDCRALAVGSPESFPRLPERKRPTRQRRVGIVARRGSRILLFRRPDDSELLAGTWEIPSVRADRNGRLERRLRASYGGTWELGERVGTVRHAITYRALEVEVVLGRFTEDETVAGGLDAGWFTPREVAGLASSSLVGKILSRAGEPPRGRCPKRPPGGS